MDNQKILKDRWNKIDKLISSFLISNNKISNRFYDDIQDIFDTINFTYEDMYKYADIKYIAKLRKNIDKLKETTELKGFIGYQLNNMYKRIKLKNNEVLIGLLMVEFYKKNSQQDELENSLFEKIMNISYEEGQKEAIKIKKPRKKRLFTLPQALMIAILTTPMQNGFKWEEYKTGNINYNVQQVFKVINIKMQQNKVLDVNDIEFKKIFNKEQNYYINKKKDIPITERYIDKYSGMLDNYVCFIANQTALEGMKKQDIIEVQFVAVIDDNTTDMCESLNGQIFNIYDWNTYSRYSKADDKNIIYKTKGLEVGANMPPIDNGFHYCRSTIYPYK